MSRVALPFGEQQVEPVLRGSDRGRNADPERCEARGAYRDQQGLNRFQPLPEVGDPPLDEIRPRVWSPSPRI